MLTSVFAADADIVSVARSRGKTPIACVRGQSWQWDDVRFEVLHPEADNYREARLNERPFLRHRSQQRPLQHTVDGGHRSAQRTGAGRTLRQPTRDVTRDVAVDATPRQSRFINSRAFIDAVAPKLALINAGYRNRFGIRVKRCWHAIANVISKCCTDWHGAITLEFC